MSRIVIFGAVNTNLDDVDDPSIKIYLVGESFDYNDEMVKTIQNKNILDFYIDEKLEEVDEPILFIDCTGFSKNYLDVMYRLQTSRFDKRTYLVGPTLEDDIELVVKDLKFTNHFNPFDGDEIPKGFKEKQYLMNFFHNLSEITYYYLEAGFDKKQVLEIPPGWTMNLAGKEINALIRYYGLFPIAEDQPLMIEYCHNSQYRQVVLECLIAVVSNFVIRNKIVDISEIDNWQSAKNWKFIKEKF
jgi:hypothetical protein